MSISDTLTLMLAFGMFVLGLVRIMLYIHHMK